MSAKINLLPEVKQAKINEQSNRRLAVTLAAGVSLVAIGVLVLSFIIIQGQKLRIAQLTSSIKNKKQELKDYPDASAILSLQARVDTLPKLYGQRIFMTKLAEVLTTQQPNDTAFSSLAVEGETNVSIVALGKSYMAAARLARSMENAKAKVNGSDVTVFSNVVLSAVTLSSGTTNYSITASVNPETTRGQ